MKNKTRFIATTFKALVHWKFSNYLLTKFCKIDRKKLAAVVARNFLEKKYGSNILALKNLT